MSQEMESNSIEYYLSQVSSHLDDPNWLSNCAIKLATLMWNMGAEMAEMRLLEERAAINYMDQVSVDGAKKPSVAESEKRATSDTNNRYEQLKLQREAVVETINSIKKRLDVLQWERKNG